MTNGLAFQITHQSSYLHCNLGLYSGLNVAVDRIKTEPALEPPAPPGRGGLTILRGLMSQLVNFFTVHQMCFPTSKALECSKMRFFSQENR